MISQIQQLVTIGIPLYNEEKYIEDAIRSAASQCATVWVSDNASTDESAEICEKVSREYPNVHFVRQPHNVGAIANFKFLLDRADTPYFMWLGGHDALPDGYVKKLLILLEEFPEAVLAYGFSRQINLKGETIHDYDYFFNSKLSDRLAKTRVLSLIRHLSYCSLIHGIFRTDALQAAWEDTGTSAYLGADHVLLTNASLRGPFLYSPETYLIRREAHPIDTSDAQVKRMNPLESNRTQSPYREMQCRQYAQAEAVSKGDGLSGFFFRLRTRFYLIQRFGPFGETFTTHSIDWLLEMNSRWIGKCLKWLERKDI